VGVAAEVPAEEINQVAEVVAAVVAEFIKILSP
jgi:hypothetical protein